MVRALQRRGGVGLAILPDNRDELPAVAESAILYEVDSLVTILTVYVRRAPSAWEMADARDFGPMDSDASHLMQTIDSKGRE